MHAQWGQAEDLFDGSEHTDRRVGSGDNRTLLDVGANDEGKTAVAADVVGAILRIVFNHEDERVVGVGAVGDLVDRQSYRVVVVGNLKLRRVHTETRAAEAAEMVMIVSQESQIGHETGLDLLVEFPRPFRVAEEIGEALVEGTEAEIGAAEQFFLRRPRNLHRRLHRARTGEIGRDSTYIESTQIGVEAVVANGEASLKRGIPEIARALLAIRTVSFHFVGIPGKQVWIGRIERLLL